MTHQPTCPFLTGGATWSTYLSPILVCILLTAALLPGGRGSAPQFSSEETGPLHTAPIYTHLGMLTCSHSVSLRTWRRDVRGNWGKSSVHRPALWEQRTFVESLGLWSYLCAAGHAPALWSRANELVPTSDSSWANQNLSLQNWELGPGDSQLTVGLEWERGRVRHQRTERRASGPADRMASGLLG